ncbi:hypothetical protein M885DRAFT_255715 [Pelagophyceae sp. CCMP2097]|nr:hypothetical protein M885DRAFT_255715 [Pelagophyceae sp. CCMP2097]
MRRSALCWALCAALSPPGPAQRRARQRPTPSADQSAAPAVEPTPPLDVAWSADAGGWSADAAEFGWTAEDAADSGWTADLDSLPASVPFGAEMGFGETQQVEFKSCAHGNALGVIKDKVGRYIVALANTAGGVIIFGIEDDGIVSGVPLDREDKAQVTRLVDGTLRRRLRREHRGAKCR